MPLTGNRIETMNESVVPVALFVYSRPHLLRRVLAALRANQVPLLYIFSDGPRDKAARDRVAEVRSLVRTVDWCETRIQERSHNLGLGISLRTGVTEVLNKHDRLLVMEDDILCIPGTYRYLCAALTHYADDRRVMSVTGWTHPRLRPPIPAGQPYFDGRFCCWGWGTWRRAWQGMTIPAHRLLWMSRLMLRDVNRYGTDLPATARDELVRNIWAVRFCMLHILHRGLCMHPPFSLTNHIGFDDEATNARNVAVGDVGALNEAAPVSDCWPVAGEHPDVPRRWQEAYGAAEPWSAIVRRHARGVARRLRRMVR